MEVTEFYRFLLGLDASWDVGRVVLAVERVDVFLEYTDAARHRCPLCGFDAKACDVSPQRTWRHLDTCRKRTFLHSALPVVDCPTHGRQQCNPPWANRDSSLTSALEHLLAQFAEIPGGQEKAAGILGIEPAHLLHLKQRAKEAEKPQPAQPARPAPAKASSGSKGRQYSLFEQNDMSFANRGIQAFRSMELEKALEFFRQHKRLYPGGYDVTSREAAAEFLVREIEKAPADPLEQPGYLCGLWNTFEEYVEREHPGREAILAEVKPAFFARIVESVDRSGPVPPLSFPGNIPMGYILLQAGRYDEAVRSLQHRIMESPHDASLYGYLGDAYLLRKDVKTARQCYREACLIDPAGMDWRHLQDKKLQELKQDLRLHYGSDSGLLLAWLPSHARIIGLFERRPVRVNDGMKEIVEDYLAMEKDFSAQEVPLTAARLFFRGIILCENQENLRFIKRIDVIQIRRMMKKANPHLFEDFLEGIEGGGKGGNSL